MTDINFVHVILHVYLLLTVPPCRSLETVWSVPSTGGSTTERRDTAPRSPIPKGKSPARQRSKSGRRWRPTASSWCGTMRRGGIPAGSQNSLKRSRAVVGSIMATPPT